VQPLAHLLRGFISKGDGEDARGEHPLLKYELRYSMRKHPSLSTSRASEYEDRPISMNHSLSLRVVEPLGEVRLRSGRIL
jgi:hypothetical protein